MSAVLDPESFSITARENGTCIVLEVKGELDLGTTPQFAAEVTAQDGALDLVFDLSELTFIDSTGIHALAGVCGKNGTRVVCPPGNVRRVLEIVSFGQLVTLHESLEEALAY